MLARRVDARIAGAGRSGGEEEGGWRDMVVVVVILAMANGGGRGLERWGYLGEVMGSVGMFRTAIARVRLYGGFSKVLL